MPPAWKVLTYATVVLVLFAIPVALWDGELPDTALLVSLVVMLVTVGIGIRIGKSMVRRAAERQDD